MATYITITGQKHYYGILPFLPGAYFSLKPEPDNVYDPEAVSVVSSLYGKVGYVAKNKDTLAVGTISSAELLPLLALNDTCVVRFIAGEYIIAEIYKKEDI